MQQVVSKTPQPGTTPSIGRSSLVAMGLSALGIVFGDIGTSPLYTLKTVLDLTGGTPKRLPSGWTVAFHGTWHGAVLPITDAGGSIAAVDLGIDPTTPFGEFGMTIMLALARMERRRMSESWEEAKTRALDRGARMGPTPFGYERDSDGRLQPHPRRRAPK